MRLIAPDRPGCGLSDPAPARVLLDWPRDLAALPTCRARSFPGEWHFSLPVGRAKELLRDLTSQSSL